MTRREPLVTRFDPNSSASAPIVNIRLGFNWRRYVVRGSVSGETVHDAVTCVRSVELIDNTPIRVTIDGQWHDVTPIEVS